MYRLLYSCVNQQTRTFCHRNLVTEYNYNKFLSISKGVALFWRPSWSSGLHSGFHGADVAISEVSVSIPGQINAETFFSILFRGWVFVVASLTHMHIHLDNEYIQQSPVGKIHRRRKPFQQYLKINWMYCSDC